MKNEHNGYLLIDKPYGWTSFDCVSYIKKKYQLKKAGHAGTLDPLATGLLLIMCNKATKQFDNFQHNLKSYQATFLLGASFDSLDICGNLNKLSPPDQIYDEKLIIDTINQFQGETYQTPPAYSAIKIKGKPLYHYARKKQVIHTEPRKVFIDEIKLNSYNFPYISFEVSCKKGFYVRSLCSDIATKLGTVSVLTSLRRTKQANHNITEATEISKLPDKLEHIILPVIKNKT